MEEIAPGSILQRMYFSKRVNPNVYKNFCEIGSGNGILSNLLLSKGLIGKGYDLNASACDNNKSRNAEFISTGKYQVVNGDFLLEKEQQIYDFIFSCMVIEHLDDNAVNEYFEACKRSISPNGTIAVFVPASMKYWGIEDEIAGHYKRYEFKDLNNIAELHKLKINEISGLTYPLSNWLFSLSNRIISKSEGHKKDLSMQEQTVLSGNRGVKFKTVFPWYFKLFLNPVVLYPFYILQRIFKKHPHNMVIYCEFKLS